MLKSLRRYWTAGDNNETEPSKSWHLDTASISTVIAAGPKAEKRATWGLTVDKEGVKKAGQNGIAIECISARLLKFQISIKLNFVTFVVAYAPTEEVPEGRRARYVKALNSTVVLVPVPEYVFVLTGANARTGRGSEGGGEADSKVLGAHDRDVFNDNGKLLLGFAEDNKLALVNTFYCIPKSDVSYTFQSANCSKRQAHMDYILIK